MSAARFSRRSSSWAKSGTSMRSIFEHTGWDTRMQFDPGRSRQTGASTMRFSRLVALAAALVACATASAQTAKYDNVGKTATPEEIRARDITILPSGKGLPPGKGTAKEGAAI